MAIKKITLDGQIYNTWKGSYVHRRPRHSNEQYTITGQLDRMDGGLGKHQWEFTLACPTIAIRNAFWVSAAKTTALSFTDIDEAVYNIYLQDTGDEQFMGMAGTHWVIPITLHEV